MKKIFLLYIAGLFTSVSFAQTGTGINTASPQGPFHIDAKGNNNTPGVVNTSSDDVIVDANGNLGIGTIIPTEKVHVEVDSGSNGFRLSDGSEEQGRMLMSRDDLGTAVWVPKPFSVKQGSVLTSGTMNTKEKNYMISDQSLFLAPGIWMIMGKYAVKGNSDGFYYWTYLHDLDDTDNLTVYEGVKSKRVELLPSSKVNPNWYLNETTSWENALSVVGILPEQKQDGHATPVTRYTAVISSPGKNPGDPGYEHEIVMTFSTSGQNSGGFTRESGLGGYEFGVYFFALRLDVDMNSL